jgi:hypothetical protein
VSLLSIDDGGGCWGWPRRTARFTVCFLALTRRCSLTLVQAEMLGHYLGEFSICYKPTLHGRPGLGATHSSRFIPLK